MSVLTNPERGVPGLHPQLQILRLQHGAGLGAEDRPGEAGGRRGVRVPGGGQGEGDQDPRPHPPGDGQLNSCGEKYSEKYGFFLTNLLKSLIRP